MYSGIIIVFHNDAESLNVNQLISFFIKNSFKICLVNNASSDATKQHLERIKVQVTSGSEVFVLDNKHNKGLKNAIKSGARFLANESDFEAIIYLEANMIPYLKYIKEYFEQIALEQSSFKALPTRSDRNVLKNVYHFKELLKVNSSF